MVDTPSEPAASAVAAVVAAVAVAEHADVEASAVKAGDAEQESDHSDEPCVAEEN